VLFQKREIKKRILIVITSDRGLAGAYNANVLKLMTRMVREDDDAGVSTAVVTIGRKASQFVAKLENVEEDGAYQIEENVTVESLRPILNSIVGMFRRGEVDAVDVIATRFVNSFTQTAEAVRLLPAGIEPGTDDDSAMTQDIVFEPSAQEVLDYVAVRLVEAKLYQAALDAKASEHAMRRVAMKNASDNAGEIVDDLTLEMNKVRQAAITQELAEISSGAEAMK
jgi:F-type H+-transporting ATPase subunit gamma